MPSNKSSKVVGVGVVGKPNSTSSSSSSSSGGCELVTDSTASCSVGIDFLSALHGAGVSLCARMERLKAGLDVGGGKGAEVDKRILALLEMC